MWRPRKDLSVHTVWSDSWDRADLSAAARRIRPFMNARRTLNATVVTGTEAVNDAFFLLLKADPMILSADNVAPSHLVNRAVMSELAELSATRQLRQYTVGDRREAAMAVVSLLPTLEGLFDRLAALTGRAEELDRLWSEIEELSAEVAAAQDELDAELGEDPSSEDFAAAYRTAENLAELKGLLEELDDALREGIEELNDENQRNALVVRSDLSRAVGEIVNDARSRTDAQRAWGLEPGDLNRLPADERVALARRLDTARVRDIGDLFGRMENFARSTVADRIEDANEEVYDLELGAELGRLAPSEFLYLTEPAFEGTFLSRMADRELMQYAVRGPDDAGRGGIVMCIDGSGSMHGDRARFAGALMLVLLHQARRQQRPMTVVHFGGPQRYETIPFVSPEDFTPVRLLDAAEIFFGGGTDFHTPMSVALDLLHAEAGSPRADVVFVTDDECRVDPGFMQTYLAEMHAMGARTWGVLVGPVDDRDGALGQMSEGRIITVRDLTSGGDIGRLLRNAL